MLHISALSMPPKPRIHANEREECWPTGPELVHFRTSWRGHCRILAPSLETLAGELEGQLRIVEVNLDDSPEVAGQYGII